MTIESASFLNDLNSAYPAVGDAITEGDDHLRLIKAAIKATFPGRGKVDMGTIAEAATFSFAAAETGSVYVGTGATAANLPAVAGLPSGTHWFLRTGAAAIIVATDDTALINGVATLTVASNTGALFILNGTDWIAFLFPDTSSAAGPAFCAIMTNGSANLAVTSGVATDVRIDTEDFDIGSCFNTGTYRWTPNVPGIYQVNGLAYAGGASVVSMAATILKNGVAMAAESILSGGGCGVSTLLQMNGSTDYAHLRCAVNGTSPYIAYGRNTQFSGSLVRAL